MAPTAPSASPSARGPEILKVSDLNERLKQVFNGMGRIAVEGEVVGVKRAASGHIYFSLKDRRRGVESVLSCAIWRSQVARAQKQPLKEGDRVVAHGKLDLYGPRGSYSLIVDRVEALGLGALLVQLEELKRELGAKGWFDRKRDLPVLPNCIGVVTSRDTAAFQDFLRTRTLRWPLYPVRLAHTPVQGPGAALEIARAIQSVDASGVDVIVVTRGGGSLEDLWAFNERVVAEAIWNASVPVVSGVGHETDVTLADYVADHRAHTPTDAGQLVLPDRTQIEDRFERVWNYLVQAMDDALLAREQQLERLESHRYLRSADWILSNRMDQAHSLGRRLQQATRRSFEARDVSLGYAERTLASQAPGRRLSLLTERLATLGRRLTGPAEVQLTANQSRLSLAESRLEAFSPFAVLNRGYSITRIAGETKPLMDVDSLDAGTAIVTRLAGGTVHSTVTDSEREEPKK